MPKCWKHSLMLLLILLSSCSDSGVNPEWASWRSYKLADRISVLVPPEWAGPEYSYYEYLSFTFRLERDWFTLYCAPSLPHWYYGTDSPEYVASSITVGGRQATLETWEWHDTTFSLYLWIQEVDKDLTRYAAYGKCHSRDRREVVQKILATVRFKEPKLSISGAHGREVSPTPVARDPGARLTRAMEPTEQGRCCRGFVEAMQKRLDMCRQSPGSVAASTNILPPRLIADR